MEEKTYRVLRARRFELVDWADRPWATLGFDERGEVQFHLFNRDGRGEILLSFIEEKPEIWIFSEGNARMRLGIVRGDIEFSLSDEMDTPSLKLRVDREGAPHILTRRGEEEWRDVLATP